MSRKKWIPIMVVLALFFQVFSPFSSLFGLVKAAKAAGSTIVYQGKVSYGGSTVGYFTIDGQLAFCIEHYKTTPPTGTPNDGGKPYSNKKVAAALYWGWGGPNNIFGSDRVRGIVVTSLVLSEMYLGYPDGGVRIPGYAELKAKALAEDVPDTQLTLSRSHVNSFIDGNVQKTEKITLQADSRNKISFNLPKQVTIVNETTGASQTGGSVTVKGGDTFYLTAPLDYNSVFRSGKLKGSMKEYQPILYKMNNSKLQSVVKSSTVDSREIVQFSAHFEAREGFIEVSKKGNQAEPLAGAVFEIKDGDVTVDTLTTGPDGKAKTKGLLPNKTYTVREVKAPHGYIINRTSENIVVSAGQTSAVTFTNDAVLGQVTIYKQDSETGKTPQGEASLDGAEFDIKDANGKVVDHGVIKNGKWQSKKLPLGDYIAVETKAGKGYKGQPKEFPFSLTYKNQDTAIVYSDLTVSNDVVKKAVKVVKKDKETGKVIPLSGAKFKIEDAKGNLVGEYETAEDGSFSVDSLVFGKYKLTEIQAPQGYILNPEPVEFSIDEENDSEVVLVDFFDAPAKGEINGVKLGEQIDKETSKVNDTQYVYTPLANVEYALIAEKDIVTPDGTIRVKGGETIGTVKTDEQGKFSFKNLYLGDYIIRELKTDDDHVLGKDVKVTLSYKDQTTTVVTEHVTLENRLKKGDMELTKRDVSNGKELPNAVFKVYDENKRVVREGKTDKKGKAVFKNLPKGKYYYQETGAPAGYKLDDTLFPFEIKEDGEIVKCEMTNEKTPDENMPGGKLPTTGDGMDTALIIAGLALLTVGTVLLFRKKREKQ